MAQRNSEAMRAAGVLGVQGPAGAPSRAAAVAGSGVDAGSVVDGWLAEPAAGAVLLDCGRTAAGIATVDGWWTTVLR
jgi:hypothetical protein